MSVVTTVWLISVITLIVSTFIEAVINAKHNRTMWQAIYTGKNTDEIINLLKPYHLPGRIFRAISKVACVVSIISTFIIVCFWIASFKP